MSTGIPKYIKHYFGQTNATYHNYSNREDTGHNMLTFGNWSDQTD